MAEGFPFGYETGPEKPSKKDAPKRFVSLGRLGSELVARPRIIEKSVGDTPRPDFKSLEFSRPVGDETLHPRDTLPEFPGQRASLKPEVPKVPGVEHRANLPVEVENLADLAAEQVEAMRHLQELELEKSPDEEDDAKDKRKKSEGSASPPGHEEVVPLLEESGTPVHLMEGAPEAIAAAEFREHPGVVEGVSESGSNGLGPEQEQIWGQTAAANAEFQSIARREDLARLATMHLPEIPPSARAKPEGFGDEFNEIVRNSLGGEAPRAPRFIERAPGELPIDNNAGGEGPPDYPPTAEGGAWDGEWSNPNRARTPSGVIVDAVTWAGLAGLALRERFHNAQRAMNETALFGGELLLAAGLIGEHFLAKHRDKKLERAFDKQIKKQNEVLDETTQALQQERFGHQRTRREFKDLAAAHTATEERLNRDSGPIPSSSIAETVPASGLAGTVVTGELSGNLGRAVETIAQPQSRVAAERDLTATQVVGDRREFGPAVSHTPETSGAHSVTATELAVTSVAQGREIQRGESPEDEAAFNGDTLRLERRHERLDDNSVDNSGRRKTGAADSASAFGVGLPPPQTSPLLEAREDFLASTLLQTPSDTAPNSRAPWVLGIVLIILAAALVAIFAL